MASSPPVANWISIDKFASRFEANLAALATRYPDKARLIADHSPTEKYSINIVGDQVVLGVDRSGVMKALPAVLPPASAMATVNSMFPDGKLKVAMVAGEDLGWLWNALYQLPIVVPNVPGHRPPIFFLMKDIERLRVILHIQDWRVLLADARVRLYIGDDCVSKLRQSLLHDLRCPWPALWVTVTPEIWPAGLVIDSIFAEARAALNVQLADLTEKQKAKSDRSTPQSIAATFTSSCPLKVLGITSRYTSFLQHSMRDWLDGFRRLGHTVHLQIEHADHELSNNLVVAQTCADFEPDLIVAIDHYRKSLAGVPDDVPVVMWIQDALPALFNKDAGAAQGPNDFAISVDPLKMVHEFGYPPGRMISALIGVNENRFNVPANDSAASRQYACDVCFVSHASRFCREDPAKAHQRFKL